MLVLSLASFSTEVVQRRRQMNEGLFASTTTSRRHFTTVHRNPYVHFLVKAKRVVFIKYKVHPITSEL